MAETAHYKLYINSDEKLKFKTFREEVAGETDSNMTKIDAALKAHDDALEGKQSKITGTIGQVVGFDAKGNAVPQAAPDTGVTSFNGRAGPVTPQAGDYTAAQVGARPNTWTPTAADVGASPVGHKHTKSDISDFPASMPASDVYDWAKAPQKPAYTAAEVGASTASHSHTAAQVGAKASGWAAFYAGTSAPSDKTQLWIDTTANTGVLKYYNGSAWVAVPVAWG